MCNRSYGSAVLISMASYQGESCKTGMHSFAFGIGGAIGMVIFAPILYGITGFIAGILGALIYNLAAGVVGGVQFEFKYDEGQL
jgi:VIT1/CCC1 family predicted Fe2+/Mn2+ transporter